MSDAALIDESRRERDSRQRWAVPGSSHDRIVRFAKIALPSAVGMLIAFLALAPLDRGSEVSFILDKKKVDNAPERMRVEAARYVGEDNRGQRFEVTARSALQRSSEVPTVDINGMVARLALSQGPVTVAANHGRYDLDSQRVAIVGPVKVAGPDGYKLSTSDVLVDLKARQVRSDRGVSGEMRLGTFTAGRMRADLGTRTIVLDGGTRLKIVQGGVR
jgi:lipopolysaccharide export system protein LptC